MKILVTGASGFIGGFLVQEALNRGYEVWAGIRKSSNRAGLTDERIHFIDLPYENEEQLVSVLSHFKKEHGGWDYIIHNAGLTKTTDKNAFFKVNAENTRRFIAALSVAGCAPKKFLLMSSLSSFGKGDEKGFTPICLTDKQMPDTAYGKSKLLAENYLRTEARFPYIIFRPTGVYGPGEKDYYLAIKSVAYGLDFAVGFVPQRLTFIYVKDLARAVFLALEKEDILNKEYFISDGDVYTDKAFVRLILQTLGKKHALHVRIPLFLICGICFCSELIGKLLHRGMTLNSDKYLILKQRNWICDVEPLRKELGFVPEYRLDRGLDETIKWYKERGWLK